MQGTLPHYVLLLCVGGAATYEIGSERYTLRDGEVLLAPPHVRRAGSHDPARPFYLYSLHFQARLYGVLDVLELYGLPRLMRPPAQPMRLLVEGARRMLRELADAQSGYLLRCNATCTELLVILWREAQTRVAAEGERRLATARLERLAPVFRAIETRFAEPLTLAALASLVHLHPAYFSSVFRQTVGIPPLRYLSRYRLDRVRELLLTTELSLQQIAGRTGFRDAAYLSRVFRDAEQTTPTVYRRSKKSPIIA